MLIRQFRKWWAAQDHQWDSPFIDGYTADQYTDLRVREQITREYQARYCSGPTPFTHPEQFDPLNPPLGYKYDPYYELWIKTP
jgi:hypothetical protein